MGMKRIYTILVGIIDVVLLVVIIRSATAKKPETSDSSSSRSSESRPARTEAAEEPGGDIFVPEGQEVQTEAIETQPAETTTAVTTTASAPSGPDSAKYSTDDFLEYADIQDISLDGQRGLIWGERSGGAVSLTDFSSVTGGWKTIILANPSDMEHSVAYHMNMDISGSESALTVTLHWHYYSIYATGDSGSMDDQSDTVYEGTWDGGSFEGYGEGSLTLEDFYLDGGKEYATGKISWPDGTWGSVALVRP